MAWQYKRLQLFDCEDRRPNTAGIHFDSFVNHCNKRRYLIASLFLFRLLRVHFVKSYCLVTKSCCQHRYLLIVNMKTTNDVVITWGRGFSLLNNKPFWLDIDFWTFRSEIGHVLQLLKVILNSFSSLQSGGNLNAYANESQINECNPKQFILHFSS